MKRLFLLIVAVIALIGCKRDDIAISSERVVDDDIFYASFEGVAEETRTYLDENVMLLWHEDDRITLFRTTLNEQFKFTGATGDNSGGFALVSNDEWATGNAISTSYGVYPYDKSIKISNKEVIQLTMPAVQSYAKDSFGRGANTMIAATENSSSKFLPFRNLGGYLIVKLYGENTTIKSIMLEGNNDEVLAGAATAEAKYGYLPVVTMLEGGGKSITLDCGDGVKLSTSADAPTSFWLVVPPITFEKGFTLTITEINGDVTTKSTTKPQTIVRNEVKSMFGFVPTFDGNGENPNYPSKPAYNEIWYTSSDGNIVEPYSGQYNDYADALTTFGANIVSNNYKDGKGVITFDGNVTTIGEWAFWDCDSLTSVTIPDSVTTIGEWAFWDCDSLTSVTIPDSVTTIGEWAFYDCNSLTSVTIPDSVTTIGKMAFVNCDSLTSVTIGDSVTTIGESAFQSCWSLTSVTIPDSVTTIGYCAFADCRSLTSVTIPDSVTTIGKMAFAYCRSLTSITIPDSVTTIGGWAFEVCTSLTSVTIGDGVTTIGDSAFVGCDSLKKFKGKFASDNGRCLIVDGVLNSFAIGCGATDYTIPDSVTTIGRSAFSSCNSLTSITIGDSVTTIGDYAFSSCDSLKEFKGKFAADNGRCLIVDGGLNSFANGCGTTEYTIPDSVTTIRHSAFYGCTSLTSVTIPDSVTTIGDHAFYECTSLASVTIPDSVTTIGYAAFAYCDSLTSVTIGDSVTTIGDYAFAYCTDLTSVYCKATTPSSLGSSAFKYYSDGSYSNNIGCKIYVPRGCGSAYKSAPYWNDYAADIVEYDF